MHVLCVRVLLWLLPSSVISLVYINSPVSPFLCRVVCYHMVFTFSCVSTCLALCNSQNKSLFIRVLPLWALCLCPVHVTFTLDISLLCYIKSFKKSYKVPSKRQKNQLKFNKDIKKQNYTSGWISLQVLPGLIKVIIADPLACTRY